MYDLIVILIPLFPLLAVLANGLNVMLGHRYSHDIAHRIGWVSVLLLVMGNNYAVLFIGWEGVGLCSYLLIGYYYDRVSAAKAATKAFVVNRIGDAGFLIAIFLVFAHFGTLDYIEVFATAGTLDSATAFAIAVCLLIGAVGKSAQLPPHTWLPDARE